MRSFFITVFLIFGILAGCFFYVKSLTNKLEKQAVTIAELNIANKTLEDNNERLTKVIDANNKAIEKMAKSAADTNKAFTALNGSVKDQAADLQKRLKDILNEPKPETCEATIRYLIEATKEYK